jgi:alpha-beta hydrolase superfamily lysophospholipase
LLFTKPYVPENTDHFASAQRAKPFDIMFSYFPGNYMWSSAINLALMAGADLGQIDRFLRPLQDVAGSGTSDSAAWNLAWTSMAEQQERLAMADLARGYSMSAEARYTRAAIYHLTAERQTPVGPSKTASYHAGIQCFGQAAKLLPQPLEHIVIPSPDGLLPGYMIPSHIQGIAPVVIFYNGFDVTKEILYGIIKDTFARRGIACLVVDTPGTGEPLRLRNVASRPDYEVPTRAIVDYLATRKDIDASRIGLLGISLGGYYAPRGAAFEPRIKAVAAWGAIWDYGQMWQTRWETSSSKTSVPFWQLPWVMGTPDFATALERAQAWKLEDALPYLKQPFLIVHGENDAAVSVDDARKCWIAAGSKDKELRIFTAEEGGSEHVGADDPDPSRQFIADWFATKL